MAKSPSRVRIAPVRTLALESPADLHAFRASLAKRFRLPRIRIALRLSGLPEALLREHERRMNRLLTRLGYREALAGVLILVTLAVAFPLSPAGPGSTSAISAWVAQGMLALLVGARGGQLVGLWLARSRLSALCFKVARLAEIQGPLRS